MSAQSQAPRDDEQAIRLRIESNIGLAYKAVRLCRGLIRQKADADDAVGAALLALCRAAWSFRPELGNTFGTYAVACCRHAIVEEMLDRGVIRTPRASRPKAGSRRRAAARLKARFPEPVTPIVEEKKLLVETDPGEIHPHDAAIALGVIDLLPAAERQAIRGRLAGETDAATGAALGITRARAGQLHKAAIARLHARFAD